MTKDDKLKEHLAEERHEDLLAVALGAFGFAGVAVAFAYWQIRGWAGSLTLALLLVVFLGVLAPLFNRRKHAREKLIEKSDDQEQSSKSQTTTS
jgi:cbb3-type cytochrome oxidase subunit 3